MAIFDEIMEGGGIGNGSATYSQIYNLTSQSGGLGSGNALSTFNNTLYFSGGGLGSGTATNTVNYAPIQGSGGGLGGGVASVSRVTNFSMSGGGLGGGTYRLSYFYIGDGGVIAGGEADTFQSFLFDLSFTWDDQALILFDKSFTWDDGPQVMKWFRVVGCCQFPTAAGSGDGNGGPPSQPGGCEVLPFESDDPKCLGALGKNTFIQNIAARSLSEVCRIMKDNKWTWPVCSISEFSRPADNRFVDPNSNCNALTQIPYCEVPECMDFCLLVDGNVYMGMDVSFGFVGVNLFEYVGNGGLIAGGEADTETDGDEGDLEFTASGGAIGSGDAIAQLVKDYGYSVDSGINVTVEDVEVFFSNQDNNTVALTPDDDTISTRCTGCNSLPLTLAMTHNLNIGGVLVEFLNRNGLVFPTNLFMYYSRKLACWQSQLHFRGFSNDNSTNEAWRILFDWSCVDTLGSQDLGSYVWKFGLSVLRKNLTTGVDFDTRMLLAFPPGSICVNAETSGLDFAFSVNTQNFFVTTELDVVPDVVLLYDNIGLFKSQTWVDNPNFNIRVAELITEAGFISQDISPIFPEPTIFTVTV